MPGWSWMLLVLLLVGERLKRSGIAVLGRQGAARIIQEVVGIHVLVTHAVFASDIPHGFLLRVSPAKSTSVAWAVLMASEKEASIWASSAPMAVRNTTGNLALDFLNTRKGVGESSWSFLKARSMCSLGLSKPDSPSQRVATTKCHSPFCVPAGVI